MVCMFWLWLRLNDDWIDSRWLAGGGFGPVVVGVAGDGWSVPAIVCLLAVGSDFGASCGPNAGDRGRRAIVGRESDGQ